MISGGSSGQLDDRFSDFLHLRQTGLNQLGLSFPEKGCSTQTVSDVRGFPLHLWPTD
ncbi:hypothetical protein YC2023_036224 [Brassica napus]